MISTATLVHRGAICVPGIGPEPVLLVVVVEVEAEELARQLMEVVEVEEVAHHRMEVEEAVHHRMEAEAVEGVAVVAGEETRAAGVSSDLSIYKRPCCYCKIFQFMKCTYIQHGDQLLRPFFIVRAPVAMNSSLIFFSCIMCAVERHC